MTAVLLVAAVAAAATAFVYRDQLVRYLTHLEGSPRSTEAWAPFPTDDPPRLHFAAAGDVGEAGSRLDATAATIAEIGAGQRFDALLLLGDNAYPKGDPAALDDTVFAAFGPVFDQGTELLAVLGNHDVMSGHADAQVDALGMGGRWWARHFDGLLLLGLDSELVDVPDQKTWLEATLAAAEEPWRVVMVHESPYSAGYQGSNRDVREQFVPLFERYRVQLVLSGHDHDYQRSEPIDGVTYVVSGGAARTRRTGSDAFTAVSFSWHHFLEIGVYDDRLVLRAVNQERRVGDEVVIPLNPAGA